MLRFAHAVSAKRRRAWRNDITVNALLLESDLIIATGVVEPHQFAGYSGGGKTVVIGCGSEETIGLTHGPQFLDHPGVRLDRSPVIPFSGSCGMPRKQLA